MFGLEAKAIVLGIVGLAFLALIAAVHHYRSEYQVEHAQFEGFKAQTAALGELAKQHAKEIAEKDAKLKEQADAENARTVTDLRSTIARMRNAVNAGRGGLSAPAPSPQSPDRTCLDPAKFSTALRVLDEGFLGILEIGSKAVIDLDTAKAWARSLSPQP